MLQITLDSTGRQSTIQSVNSQSWDFKLRVINEGDSTELRISFNDEDTFTETNSTNDIVPMDGLSDLRID